MDIGYGLENEVVVVTGAGGQIGQHIVQAFLAAGCFVAGFDINSTKFKDYGTTKLQWFLVNITNEEHMRQAWSEVTMKFGKQPGICIAAAGLDLSFIDHHTSICDMPVEQFRSTLEVNTIGTFITAKTWLSCIKNPPVHIDKKAESISLVIIGSEAGVMGVPGNADYAASKSAIQYGLMLSISAEAVSVRPDARVNAVAPGAVNTPQFQQECAAEGSGALQWFEAEATVASRRPVDPSHVARTCLLLASSNLSGSTNGQIIRVDAGKSGRMFWDNNGNPTWK